MKPAAPKVRKIRVSLRSVTGAEAHRALGAVVDMLAGALGATFNELELLDVAIEEIAEVLCNIDCSVSLAASGEQLLLALPQASYDRVASRAVVINEGFQQVTQEGETAVLTRHFDRTSKE